MVRIAAVDRELTKYTKQNDCIWFPITEERLGKLSQLDVSRMLANFGRSIQHTVIAIEKTDYDYIMAITQAKITAGQIIEVINSFTSEMGYIIPNISLPGGWIVESQDREFIVQTLLARVALSIDHMSVDLQVNLPESLVNSNSPMGALELGQGNCFHRASIMVAALRKNGFPARVVGNSRFFREENGDHWWVEFYYNKEWVPIDPSPKNEFVKMVRGISAESELQILACFHNLLAEVIRREINIFAIYEPIFTKPFDERIIAAEVDR